MFKRGYLDLGHWGSIPIQVHWSVLPAALLFGRFSFVPVLWLAYFLLIFWHEVGHAFFVQRFGLDAIKIEVTGLGGTCHWRGNANPLQRALIAWGGVFFQLLLLWGTLTYLAIFGSPQSAYGLQLQEAWIYVNLWLIAINLLPIAPLDGAEAWSLFPLLWKRLLVQKKQTHTQNKNPLNSTQKNQYPLEENARFISKEAKELIKHTLEQIDQERDISEETKAKNLKTKKSPK